MELQTQVNQPEVNGEIGIWQSIIGVTTSPGATFERLAQAPVIWKPSLILALIAALFTAPFYGKFAEYSMLIVKKTLTQTSSQMPAGADINQAINVGATVGGISAVVTPILGMVLFPILVAALLKLLNFVMGEEAKYKQLWTVAIFSQVPSLIGILLGNLLLLTASGDNLVTTLTLKTSLGNLVPISAVPPYLFVLLTRLDVFSLWGMVLTVIGTAKVFRIKPTKVGSVVFGVWLIYVLVSSYFGQATMIKLLS